MRLYLDRRGDIRGVAGVADLSDRRLNFAVVGDWASRLEPHRNRARNEPKIGRGLRGFRGLRPRRSRITAEVNMVNVTWVPEPPPNADDAQLAIDEAFGPPHSGRVELRWEGNGWHVSDATKLTGGAHAPGEKFMPLWEDRRAAVEAALREAGFPVNPRFGSP